MSDIVVSNPMLLRLDAACHAIAEAKSMDEVKVLRDQAQAMQHYLKQQKYSVEIQQDAAELKIRAERRLGEMLTKTVRPGNPQLLHDETIGSLPKGVDRNQSHRWQKIASVPEEVFEKHIVEARSNKEELTTAGVMRLAKQTKKEAAKESNRPISEACTVDELQKLIIAKKTFGTIYADPPWQYGNQATRASTDNHYQTMTVDAIAALPIRELAADMCHLHLWTTNAFLFDCQQIMKSWGFEYKSVFVWVKPQMGIGNYWRVSHEFLLLGVKGMNSFLDNSCMSWIQAERGEHSAKPHSVRKLVEKVSPGPRLELFGREVVDGWVVWGNQIERTMFDNDVRKL